MCTLPAIQIDTWGVLKSRDSFTPEQLAIQLFRDPDLTAMSLLVSTKARSIPEIAECIDIIYQPLQPHIQLGQVYLVPRWRVRYEDMDEELKHTVLNCKGDITTCIREKYVPQEIEAAVYRIIGPSRQQGTQSFRGRTSTCPS